MEEGCITTWPHGRVTTPSCRPHSLPWAGASRRAIPLSALDEPPPPTWAGAFHLPPGPDRAAAGPRRTRGDRPRTDGPSNSQGGGISNHRAPAALKPPRGPHAGRRRGRRRGRQSRRHRRPALSAPGPWSPSAWVRGCSLGRLATYRGRLAARRRVVLNCLAAYSPLRRRRVPGSGGGGAALDFS